MSANSQNRRRHAGTSRAGVRIVAAALALGLVAMLELTGLLAWADQALMRWNYRVRGTRTSELAVVVVGVDEETVQRWGTPPYDAEKLQAITGAIVAGRPRAIGWLEPEGRLAPAGTELPLQGIASVQRRASEPLVRVPLHGDVTRVALRRDDGEAFALQLLRAAGVRDESGELRVNYLGWREPVPQVAASRVAAGDVPARTFEDKIVLVGFTSSEIAPLVSTPVGPISPAEVLAQALLTSLDGVEPQPVPPALRWLALALVALALAAMLPRLTPVRAATLLGTTAVVGMLVDYTLFADLQLLFGASRLLALVPIVGALDMVFEHRAVSWRLSSVVPALRAAASPGVAGRAPEDEDVETFWKRRGERCGQLVGARSSVLAEVTGGKIAIRHASGIDARELPIEKLDPREGALLAASRTLRPVIAESLLPGVESWIVALAPVARVRAFWILSFDQGRTPTEETFALVDQIASELSRQIGQRDLGTGSGGEDDRGLFSSPGTVLSKVDELERVARSFERERRDVEALLEALPVGVATASVSGELRYANPLIRRHLPTISEAVSVEGEIAAWLSSATGREVESCREELRSIAAGRGSRTFATREAGGVTLQISAQPAASGRTAALVIVSLPVPAALAEERDDTSAVVDLDDARRALRAAADGSIDPRMAVFQALQDCRGLRCKGTSAAVETRFADPLPPVPRTAGFRAALTAVLHDACANGSGQVVASVAADGDDVKITVDDGGLTPAAIAKALVRRKSKSAGHDAGCMAASLGAAAEKLAGEGGVLTVEELEGGRGRLVVRVRAVASQATAAGFKA